MWIDIQCQDRSKHRPVESMKADVLQSLVILAVLFNVYAGKENACRT